MAGVVLSVSQIRELAAQVRTEENRDMVTVCFDRQFGDGTSSLEVTVDRKRPRVGRLQRRFSVPHGA